MRTVFTQSLFLFLPYTVYTHDWVLLHCWCQLGDTNYNIVLQLSCIITSSLQQLMLDWWAFLARMAMTSLSVAIYRLAVFPNPSRAERTLGTRTRKRSTRKHGGSQSEVSSRCPQMSWKRSVRWLQPARWVGDLSNRCAFFWNLLKYRRCWAFNCQSGWLQRRRDCQQQHSSLDTHCDWHCTVCLCEWQSVNPRPHSLTESVSGTVVESINEQCR